jgi:hypothetical protein
MPFTYQLEVGIKEKEQTIKINIDALIILEDLYILTKCYSRISERLSTHHPPPFLGVWVNGHSVLNHFRKRLRI